MESTMKITEHNHVASSVLHVREAEILVSKAELQKEQKHTISELLEKMNEEEEQQEREK